MKRFFGLVLLILLGGAAIAQIQSGKASYYAGSLAGRKTASGDIYRPTELTAAHKSLPFHTLVRVTNLENGKEIIVRINDRGPFVKGRIIDLSHTAASQLDFVRQGIVPVKIEVVPTVDFMVPARKKPSTECVLQTKISI